MATCAVNAAAVAAEPPPSSGVDAGFCDEESPDAMESAELAFDFARSSSASPTSTAARSCAAVAVVDFAFASVGEAAPVVPAGTVAAAVTPLSEAAAALAWAVSEAVGAGGAAFAAAAGGDAIYCDSSAMAAAIALGSVLPLSSGALVSSVVGFAS